MIPAGSYNNLSSIVRTIFLMKVGNDNEARIIVVFDSDSMEPEVKKEKISTMRYMINVQFDKRIGVFCFEPNLDVYLFSEKSFSCSAIRKGTIRELTSRLEELKNKPVIKEIQAFLDKL